MTIEEATTKLAQVEIAITEVEASISRIRRLGLESLSQGGSTRTFQKLEALRLELNILLRDKKILENIINSVVQNPNSIPYRWNNL
jgi:hypothetical protein